MNFQNFGKIKFSQYTEWTELGLLLLLVLLSTRLAIGGDTSCHPGVPFLCSSVKNDDAQHELHEMQGGPIGTNFLMHMPGQDMVNSSVSVGAAN